MNNRSLPTEIVVKVLLAYWAISQFSKSLPLVRATSDTNSVTVKCENKPPIFAKYTNWTIAKRKLYRSVSSVSNLISKNSCPLFKKQKPTISPNQNSLKISNVLPNKPTLDIGSLSVITKAKAKELFSLLKNDCRLPFEFDLDGCYPRAHAMAKILEENGVITAKAFFHGSISINSKLIDNRIYVDNHAAILTMVEESGKIVPYIIEPSVAEGPMTLKDFKAQKLRGSRISSEQFTHRYRYTGDSNYLENQNFPDDLPPDWGHSVDRTKIELSEYSQALLHFKSGNCAEMSNALGANHPREDELSSSCQKNSRRRGNKPK